MIFMSSKTEQYIYGLLKEMGEDPEREGLKKTPGRVAKAIAEITAGYHMDIDRALNGAFFKADYKEMVIVKDISFYSLCEHHLLPFFGKAHIAYIPDGRIIGLSKIPRLVETFAKRLQVQERLTVQIADTIFKKLKPKGVGVVIEAQHLCMTMRGVKNASSCAATSSMLGIFRKDNRVREEFLNLIKRQ
jgi:GTP cyclohydrolase I